MTRAKYFILWFIAMLVLYMCSGNARAHEHHLADEGTLTKIKMIYCGDYIVVQTAELGIMVLTKAGDMTHQSLHYVRTDEFGCVYDIVED
jgi:hypothetical protein